MERRTVLHAKDAAVKGYQQINVLCHDKDVLVLLLAHRQVLFQKIWMYSATSRAKGYIPIDKISSPEGKRKSLLASHVITGCDKNSQFAGISKQSAFYIYDS